MRGFRGSRAAQNFNSRFDRSYQKKAEQERLLRLVETPASELIEKLPDWMKTPETLAQEKLTRPKLRLVPQLKPEPVAKVAKPRKKAVPKSAAKSAAVKRKPAAKLKRA